MLKNNIPEIAKRRKMSGRQLALKIGMSNYNHIYKHVLAKEDLSEMRAKTLFALADALDCTVDDLATLVLVNGN